MNLDTTQKKVAVGLAVTAGAAVFAALLYNYFNDDDYSDEDESSPTPSPKGPRMEGEVNEVEEYKKKGNKAFSEKKFQDAIDFYTQALEKDLEGKNHHLLYSNRSASWLAMEDHERAMEDANATVKAKSDWSKGYYRRGKVYEALKKLNEAFMEYYRGSTKDTTDEMQKLMDSLIPILPPSSLDTRTILDKEMIRHHFLSASKKHCADLGLDYDDVLRRVQEGGSADQMLQRFPGIADQLTLGLLLTNILMDDEVAKTDELIKTAQDLATKIHKANPRNLDANIALINAKLRAPQPSTRDLQDSFRLTQEALRVHSDDTILIHTYAAIVIRLLSSGVTDFDTKTVLGDLRGGLANPKANHLLIADCGIRLWFKLFENPEISDELQREEQYNVINNIGPEEAYLKGITSGAFSKVLPEPFFVEALSKVAFNNPGLEKLLIPCRSAFLLLEEGETHQTNAKNRKRNALAYALALQSYRTNYAWQPMPSDLERVQDHLKKAGELLEADEGLVERGLIDESLAHHLLMISLFQPLHTVPNVLKAVRLADLELVHPFWKQILEEPIKYNREQELERTLEVVGTPSDLGNGLEVAVWDSAGLVAGRLCQIQLNNEIEWIFPAIKDKIHLPTAGCSALVVACGSGQEVYQMANLYSNVHVTGMDPSRRNVAFAQRQLEDLQVPASVAKVVVGDINELDQHSGFTEQFDFVVGSNVLHYAKNAAQTLANMSARLKKGGFMRISVYAEHHVAAVAAGRKFLRDNGMSDLFDKSGSIPGLLRAPTQTEINTARTMILDSEVRDLDALVMNPNFYTLSGFTELLFSNHIRSFSFKQIGELLGNDLQLVGFEFPGMQQHYVLKYRVDYPGDDNLTNVETIHEFDAKNPEAFRQFTSSIQFVCYKP